MIHQTCSWDSAVIRLAKAESLLLRVHEFIRDQNVTPTSFDDELEAFNDHPTVIPCAHCGNLGANLVWGRKLCSDERKVIDDLLCTDCDIQLNNLMLLFFNDPEAVAKMQSYKDKVND